MKHAFDMTGVITSTRDATNFFYNADSCNIKGHMTKWNTLIGSLYVLATTYSETILNLQIPTMIQ